MRGAVPLAHLVETVVVAEVEAVVGQEHHRGVSAEGGSVERIEEPPDLVIHVGAGGEIGAHDLPPCLVPGLFRRPLAIGDIGGLVNGEARLRPVVIVGMRDVGPADLRGVVLGIEPVGADQVVMRVLETQLNQRPAGRVGAAEEVDRVLRDMEVVEAVILRPVIVGMVHALDARTLVQIGVHALAFALVVGRRFLVKEDAAVVLGHGLVVGIHLARGEIVEPRAAQVVLPRLLGPVDIAPEPVEIDQPRAEGRDAGRQLRAAGRAERHRGIGIGEARRAGHETVEIGGLDPQPEGIPPGVDVDQVIDPDQADMALLRGMEHLRPPPRGGSAGARRFPFRPAHRARARARHRGSAPRPAS
jgi:hypothetical protein